MTSKKRLFFCGVGLVSVFLLLGAVKVVEQAFIEPRLITSWGELCDEYLSNRIQSAPLVPPIFNYEDAVAQMKVGDFSFLAEGWAFPMDGGTYYVPKKSKLKKLTLPLTIMIYEDIQRGEIVILSSVDGEIYQGEVLFTAPEFMPYEGDFPLTTYLFDELAPRRIVWQVTLKPEEDALVDLALGQRSSLQSISSMEAGGIMMAMSAPASVDGLTLGIEGKEISVYVPEGFTNRVEIYSTDDLVSNDWTIAVQDLLPSSTNPAVWVSAQSGSSRFFRVGNMDIDSDLDALPDAREIMVHKTRPDDLDTDVDGVSDSLELAVGMNPLSSDSDGDGLSDLMERKGITNPVKEDSDDDGLWDDEELSIGTNPTNPDTDNDGMSDGYEQSYGLDPGNADDQLRDPDGDGYPNIYEFFRGQFHPNDPASFPEATRYVSTTGSNVFPFASWETAATNIQMALDASSNDYEIVIVADGIYNGEKNRDLRFDGKVLMLTSANGAASCIINCQNLDRGMLFEDDEDTRSVVNGITIKNGEKDEGSAVKCVQAAPLIQNCVFTGNRSSDKGAIYFDQASGVEIRSCLLVTNEASKKGAGIFLKDSDGVDIQDCIFDGNQCTGGNDAARGGGAIFFDASDHLTIESCQFSQNGCTQRGGAIHGRGGSSGSVIRGCEFKNNSSAHYGGAVYGDNINHLLLEDSCIASNETADNFGGGIYIEDSQELTFNGLEITGNTSTNNEVCRGGGIYLLNISEVQMADCEVCSNKTSRMGGGIGAENTSGLSVIDCFIRANVSHDDGSNDDDGAGLYLRNTPSAVISRCVLENNTAGDQGGALHFRNTDDGRLENCLIRSNAAFKGGAAFFEDTGGFTAINNTVIENIANAGNGGGGYYFQNGEIAVFNTILWDNVADGTLNQITRNNDSHTVSYSCVEGGIAGINNVSGVHNIVQNPEFAADGWHLAGGSPCVDAGTNGSPSDIEGDLRFDCPSHSNLVSDVDIGADECNWVDTDGDGIPDWWESVFFGGPTNAVPTADGDQDGLEDLDEYLSGCSPDDEDSDDDGMPDGWEFRHGLAPLDAADVTADEDRDGYIAVYEFLYGTSETNALDIPVATHYVSLSGTHTPPFDSWSTAATNIQSALDAAANDYDIVLVADGTYSGSLNKNLTVDGKMITLVSVGGASNCLIDCEGSGRGVVCDQSGEGLRTVLSGFSFTNGFNVEGGAVYCRGGAPLIQNCVFDSNVSDNGAANGGAVHMDSAGGAIIRRSRFIENWSEDRGGALYVLDSPGLLISECIFQSNICAQANDGDEGGGAVFFQSSPGLRIEKCVMTDNTSSEHGGAVYGKDTPGAEIVECDIINNLAEKNGGGVYGDKLEFFSVEQSVVETNCAYAGGGGIHIKDSGYSRFDNVKISGNCATNTVQSRGGGLYIELSPDAYVENCSVTENYSSTHGAGIGLRKSGDTVIRKSIVRENRCSGGEAGDVNGGGIDVHNSSSVFVDTCRIEQNTASGCGGGICFYEAAGSSVENSRISGNSAASGGAVYTESSVSSINNTVTGNTGYGYYFDGGNSHVKNTILWGNGPDQFYNSSPGTQNISYSCVEGGTELAGGGDNITNAPALCADGIHIRHNSPCRNAGTAGSAVDVDGEVRDASPDIGMDEYVDADDDGLSDYSEVLYGTDPHNSDTDGDSMPDGWEVDSGLEPLVDDSLLDLDGDKLVNFLEFLAGTTAGQLDTDEDSIPDGWEVANGYDPLIEDNIWLDADNDELADWDEHLYGTNLQNPDTDYDDMPDKYEVDFGLNPLVNDREGDLDNDMLFNYSEFQLGTVVNDFDTDDDLFPDGWEVEAGGVFDPLVPNGLSADSDGDGLSDFDEYLNNTNPNLSDSDGDSVNDSTEVNQGSNPNDSSDGGTLPSGVVIKELPFSIGDPSGSHSERWVMNIKGLGPDTRELRVASENFGEMTTNSIPLWENSGYEITINHLGSSQDEPDYDWEAQIDGFPTNRVLSSVKGFSITNTSWVALNMDGLLGTCGGASGGATDGTVGKKAYITRMGLIPDYDRNGTIDSQDEARVATNEVFRFWINDDDDDPNSEVSGDDLPGQGSLGADYSGWKIDGMRDFVDLFPVQIRLSEELCDMNSFSYHLKSEGSALNFAYTDLQGDDVTKHLTDPSYAQTMLETGRTMYTHYIGLGDGELIDADLLNNLQTSHEAVVLLEGRAETTNSLVLEVREKASGSVVVTTELPLDIRGVEKLYNRVDLRPIVHDWPSGVSITSPAEAFINGTDREKDFVFVHGYNVNEEQARGWFAQMFKRLYWSGSNAEFHGVSWDGDTSQIFNKVTVNYHVNAVHAYMTAPSLASYVNSIGGADVLSAHSLGNVVCSAAIANHSANVQKYFMLDAAVALEAYDPDPANQSLDMVHYQWGDPATGGIDERYYASEWHVLFPSDDWRNRLHWHSNFASVAPIAYNFYSSGEEVLEMHPHGNEPGILDMTGPATGNYAWALQEKLKGRMWIGMIAGSNVGGWGFNNHYVMWDEMGQSLLWSLVPTNAVIDEPLFKKDGDADDLYDLNTGSSSIGSLYAELHYGELLASQIPARSLPAGANEIPNLGDARNFDMNTSYQNGWPIERLEDGKKEDRWLHGDVKDVAYPYISSLFKVFVIKGELK